MARVAVVTGGNKGIGFGVVRALCKQIENGIVYLTSRDEERGKAAVEELKKEGLNPRFHQLDITNKESVAKLRDYLVKEHEGLDILVNNAGIAFKVKDTTPISIQAPETIATNFDAQLDVCHTLFPILRPNARVSHVASMSGEMLYPKLSDELKGRFKNASTEADVCQLLKEFIEAAKDGTVKEKGWVEASYGTSKLGFIALTRVQGEEAAKGGKGILVNCCCPGYVSTDMSSNKGPLTIEQGAVNPTHLALLPSGATEPQGKFIKELKVLDFW